MSDTAAPDELGDIIEYEITGDYEEVFEEDEKLLLQDDCEIDELQEQPEYLYEENLLEAEELEEDMKDGEETSPKFVPKEPHRFLLFDNLIAEVVDYDEEDDAPIVEFSLCVNDEDGETLPVECGICPDVMHRSRLDNHVRTHVKPGTKRYVCIYCDENFVSRAYAAGHARRHVGIRPYVCVPCKLYYCTKQDLRVHQQRRHWAKEHICEQCGKTFAQNTSMKNHIALVHEQQRRFECTHCGKRFLRNYAMKEHVRNVHLHDRRLLDCPFCNLYFKDTHKLAQHRKEHHLNQSMFECRACGLAFTDIDFFDAHRRSLQCRKKYKRERVKSQTVVERKQKVQKLNMDEDQKEDIQSVEFQPQKVEPLSDQEELEEQYLEDQQLHLEYTSVRDNEDFKEEIVYEITLHDQ